MADVVAFLARRRVALGGLTAIVALVLARPTWSSWYAGLAVAVVGEGIRVWAAGHLEKSREVTTSGPYRWMRHPLYVGSSILALGIVIAARSYLLGALAVLYLGTTITAAIRSEEAFLRRTFGEAYDRYARAESEGVARRFSLERAARNKEYRAVLGVLAGFGLLALRVRFLL
ncbi:MAG TPA: isoprenylcysteine carboxylmethyltransferase family protein [Vicinamibacterales bacterium]|nr:isoprenylcysteine carboxylmethyltransferase family protein [Vicinamibacterales bacterium]